jgi:hypothetical protein
MAERNHHEMHVAHATNKEWAYTRALQMETAGRALHQQYSPFLQPQYLRYSS